MTTGVPIYLVSACTSGEEFVAAFRRYADRSSLFVPIAEPVPTGRCGRFAVTLVGGGVMVEGEAEVISSSKTPSVLHGRIGMTIRFGELEEPSKSILIELEKARLVAKPPAPTITPRIAEMPAQPRPVPPAASARIDASTALAECVAIGDLESLVDAKAPPLKAGPKFVMPTVLPVGSPRPKTPSTPPEMRPRTPSTPPERPKTPSIPPAMPSLAPLPGSGGVPRPSFGTPSSGSHVVSGSGPTTVSSKPLPSAQIMTAGRGPDPTRPPPTASQPPPIPVNRATPATPLPVVKPPIIGEAPGRKTLVSELDETTDLNAVPQAPDEIPRIRAASEPVLLDGAASEPRLLDGAASPRGRAMLPAVTAISDSTPELIDEDINTSVIEQRLEEPAPVEAPKTGPMATPPAPTPAKPTVEEPTPSGDWTMTPGANGPTIEQREPEPKKRQTGDWTIQLDSDSPGGWTDPVKPIPKPEPSPAQTEKPKPAKPKAENPPELAAVARSIMIATPSVPAPDPVVISEEPKVQIDPTLLEGPIVDLALVDVPPARPGSGSGSMVALTESARPATMVERPASSESARMMTPVPGTLTPIDAAAGDDPRLATPMAMSAPVAMTTPIPGTLTPLPGTLPAVSEVLAAPAKQSGRIPTPVPGEVPIMTPPLGSLMVGGVVSPAEIALRATPMPMPPGRFVTDGGVGFFKDTGEVQNITGSFPTGDSTSLIEIARRRRIIVIAVSAGLVVVLGIVLVILFGGGKNTDEAIAMAPAVDAQTGSDRVVVLDGAQVVAVTPDGAVEAVVVDAAQVEVPKPAECSIDVASVPSGAEVLRDNKDVIGTTPLKLPLPCGEEVKLAIRKLKFGMAFRNATPTPEGAKVRVTLQKLMFSIKVSSQPAGASVSVNGKAVAMTPSSMKVPAFELSTLTFTKDGYGVETFKVTPKQNNQTVHAQLKKKR